MTTGPAPRIRAAVVADAPVLSRFGARVFAETFAADNDPEDMAHYLAGEFTPGRQAAEIADRGGAVLLAELAGPDGAPALVGYAHLHEGTPPPDVPGTRRLELKRFYVDASFHGRGVAQALMAAVLRAAGERGADWLWLGVWERNARAIAYYRKQGFERVGEQQFLLGRDRQTDWVMARPVAPRPSND